MSDFPNPLGLTALSGGGFVYSTALSLLGTASNISGSTAWPSANLAIFVPVIVPRQCTVYKLAIGAGATAAGNFDVGVYDAGGNRLVSSGATAKGNAVEHIINTTDIVIGPGLYYMALAADGTNNYQMWNPSGTSPIPLQKARLVGTLQMATAYTLPATATMVARTVAPVPLIAMYCRSF